MTASRWPRTTCSSAQSATPPGPSGRISGTVPTCTCGATCSSTTGTAIPTRASCRTCSSSFGDVEVPQTSYKVWEVGVVPQFVMEVASESTRLLDRDRKAGKYARLGVREYWRFDPTGELVRPPEYGVCVLGQRLAAGGRYEPLEPQPGGAVRSDVLDLDVCEVGGRLRFWDYRRAEVSRLAHRGAVATESLPSGQETKPTERERKPSGQETKRKRARDESRARERRKPMPRIGGGSADKRLKPKGPRQR